MRKIKLLFKNHKKIFFILFVMIIGGGYYFYKSKSAGVTTTTYALGTVSRGTIVSSVTATGQVSNITQVDLSPKISTAVTAVYVKEGQSVKAGDVLVQLDNRDLLNSLAQAKNSLDSANANYELKITGPTAQDLAVSQNSVDSAKASYETALVDSQNAQQSADFNLKQAQLQSTYDTAKGTLNSADISMRSSVIAADNILGIDRSSILSDSAQKLLGVLNSAALNDSRNFFSSAKVSLSDFENLYESQVSDLTQDEIDSLLPKALATASIMKDLQYNLSVTLINTMSGGDFSQSTLDSYRSNISSQEASMASLINTLQNTIQNISDAKLSLQQTEFNNQTSLQSAQNNVNSRKLAYDNAVAQYNLKIAKPRDIDLASYKTQIAQAQNNYSQALENLKNAQIIAPIDGVVAKVDAVVGIHGSDAAANPTAVTIVTPQQLATVTLNEVDAAKVKAGQKVTLNFNAIDGLSISGTVASVDEIGSVSQGVVSYNVKIALDIQDDRVKSEMSVTANIIIDEKIDTLLVPNSAVKTDSNGEYYVEIFSDNSGLSQSASNGSVTSANLPSKKTVVAGLSDDTNTEITAGLDEGDKIIVKTIISGSSSSTGASKTSSSNSALRMLSGGGGGPR